MAKTKLLTDSDIALLQEFKRCECDLQYARGENRLSLIVYEMDLKGRLERQGLLELVKQPVSLNGGWQNGY